MMRNSGCGIIGLATAPIIAVLCVITPAAGALRTMLAGPGRAPWGPGPSSLLKRARSALAATVAPYFAITSATR